MLSTKENMLSPSQCVCVCVCMNLIAATIIIMIIIHVWNKWNSSTIIMTTKREPNLYILWQPHHTAIIVLCMFRSFFCLLLLFLLGISSPLTYLLIHSAFICFALGGLYTLAHVNKCAFIYYNFVLLGHTCVVAVILSFWYFFKILFSILWIAVLCSVISTHTGWFDVMSSSIFLDFVLILSYTHHTQ